MKYIDLLKTNQKVEKDDIIEDNVIPSLNEEKKPEDILRSNGYKIKLVTNTSFGTQIDLYVKPEKDSLQNILSDYNIKIKEKSIFVIR